MHGTASPWLLCLFLFCCVFFTFSQHIKDERSQVTENSTVYIAGGIDALEGRFPYMCSIRKRSNEVHACGGFLVHQRWIVTAAHCVDKTYEGSAGSQPLIFCGSTHLNDFEEENIFNPIETVIHGSWNGDYLEGYDIAMLELDRDANLTAPILSYDMDPFDLGTNLMALGWGLNGSETVYLQDELQIATSLQVIPLDKCTQYWNVMKQQICAGDSGGPLLQVNAPYGEVSRGSPSRDLIVGVTSYGPKTCDSSKPGVYTNVGYFYDWIQNVINAEVQQTVSSTPEKTPPEETDIPLVCMPAPSPEETEDAAAPSSVSENDYLLDFINVKELNDKELLGEMVNAIERDRPIIARLILEEGLDPNSRHKNSYKEDSLLHWAAQNDSPKCAEVLVDFKAKVDIKNDDGETPLHHCGRFGSVSVAKILLNNGADVDKSDYDRWTALHMASKYGNVEVIKILIDNGADIEAKNGNGWTALHVASRYGNVEVIKALVGNGADIEAKNGDGWTALHVASAWDRTEVVKILIDNGADIEAKDDDGWRPLYAASRYGHVEVVKTLVRNGADIEAKNDDGWTSLHVASARDHTEVVKILIDNGADIEAKDDDGWRPLYAASRYGHVEVVKTLVRNGADIEAKNDDGWTSLHVASARDHTKVVKILIDNGADIEATDFDDWTPLHAASSHDRTEVVKILIDNGADIEAKDVDDWTPLHVASRYGRTEAVKILIDNGADIEAKSIDNLTPLHLASKWGHTEVVKILLKNGANDERTTKGKLHMT